ncbi:TetR/AcrR family transcriptional regulator [Pendulispora albinea]|uniref:TetR/AcrR family transcriptional regulator n=1 Tax=Pendulispora albinea TaxID=2741071 RepID=A0ABZ2M9B1_9BACT
MSESRSDEPRPSRPAPPSSAEKTRRSQRERRENTMAKLVEATIDSLREVGYAATSVKEVCRRSGISHGGLFRHYPAMLDLIIAAAEEVAHRQIAEFEKRFWGGGGAEPTLAEAMRKLRDACRSPVNAVWYELLVAARTDEPLRRALEAPLLRYYNAIRDTALRVPGIEAIPPELFETMLFTLVHVFDGESLVRTVRPHRELEERRMDLLLGLIALLLSPRA